MSNEDQRGGAPDGAHVAEVLAQVRAGVRQRPCGAGHRHGDGPVVACQAGGRPGHAAAGARPPPSRTGAGLGRPIVGGQAFRLPRLHAGGTSRRSSSSRARSNRSVAAALRELAARQLELQRAVAPGAVGPALKQFVVEVPLHSTGDASHMSC